LIDAFNLALDTGLRREEFLTLSWNDIFYSDVDKQYMIITDNLKVERMTGKEYDKKLVAVNKDLEKLLNQLGWLELKDSKHFIIDPFRKANIETMMGNCTKAFTHYYKKAFPDRAHKTLGTLRKTYISYLNKSVGDDSIKYTSHSSLKVQKNHYIDKKLVVKGYDVKIFG
jgi:integrase